MVETTRPWSFVDGALHRTEMVLTPAYSSVSQTLPENTLNTVLHDNTGVKPGEAESTDANASGRLK